MSGERQLLRPDQILAGALLLFTRTGRLVASYQLQGRPGSTVLTTPNDTTSCSFDQALAVVSLDGKVWHTFNVDLGTGILHYGQTVSVSLSLGVAEGWIRSLPEASGE